MEDRRRNKLNIEDNEMTNEQLKQEEQKIIDDFTYKFNRLFLEETIRRLKDVASKIQFSGKPFDSAMLDKTAVDIAIANLQQVYNSGYDSVIGILSELKELKSARPVVVSLPDEIDNELSGLDSEKPFNQ